METMEKIIKKVNKDDKKKELNKSVENRKRRNNMLDKYDENELNETEIKNKNKEGKGIEEKQNTKKGIEMNNNKLNANNKRRLKTKSIDENASSKNNNS